MSNADAQAESDRQVAKIVVVNHLDSLERVAEWINELGEAWGMSSKDVFRLDLVLAEGVTNVIKYGHPNGGAHDITLDVTRSDSVISLTITDQGIPFNPLEAPAAQLPNSLVDAKEGGLGIHLMRQYADDIAYRRDGPNNIFTLHFKEQRSE